MTHELRLSPTPAPPPASLATRLQAARRRAFIGRAPELATFRTQALAEPERPLTVLFVTGPGGIGKSSLRLRRFAQEAAEVGREVVAVDAHNAGMHPAGLPSAGAGKALDGSPSPGTVLLIDTFEPLPPARGLAPRGIPPPPAPGHDRRIRRPRTSGPRVAPRPGLGRPARDHRRGRTLGAGGERPADQPRRPRRHGAGRGTRLRRWQPRSCSASPPRPQSAPPTPRSPRHAPQIPPPVSMQRPSLLGPPPTTSSARSSPASSATRPHPSTGTPSTCARRPT